MRNAVLAILFCCLITPVFADQYSEDIGYNIPSAAIQPQESRQLDEIESRLVTDMMFAGKLADAMIESGVYSKYVKSGSSDDYASLRTKLIFWIRSHPKDAALIHMAGALPAGPSGVQSYDEQKIAWALNTHFVDLSKQLALDAKNGKLSEEEASVAMRRLFEGTQAPADAGTPTVDMGGRGSVSSGGAPRIQLAPFNWKVDSSAMDSEVRDTSSWLSTLRSDLNRDKASAVAALTGADAQAVADSPELMQKLMSSSVNGVSVAAKISAGFSQREGLIADAAKEQTSFADYITRFAGRGKIQASEAQTLNSMRSELRDKLAKSYVAGRMDGMVRVKGALAAASAPAAYGDQYARAAQNLAAMGDAIKALYDAAYSLAVSGAPAEEVYAKMNEACAADDNWRALAHIYCALPELKVAAARLWSDRALYRLFGRLSQYFYPRSNYALAERGLRVYGALCDSLAGALAAGNYGWAMSSLSSITDQRDPHKAVTLFATQYSNCVRVVNTARIETDIWQSTMFELPFYRPAAPFLRAALKHFLPVPRR
jgi:hypothetical protein